MKLADIPDIEFVDIDEEKIKTAVLQTYTEKTGRTLAQGDPVRLFVLTIAEYIIRLLNIINITGKQNLIKYAGGDYLDALGANAWTTRLPASAAVTTIEATLSATRESAVVIPAGTRVSPQDKIYFATDKDLIIPAGELTGQVTATCTETGESGNGYLPGEIATIVDPVPYVASMINVTKSEGGASVEDDEAFRQRIWEAPEALSVAGPAGAYRAKIMAANSNIIDVYPYSPSAGVVRNVIMLKEGKIPGEEILREALAAVSAQKDRPLTDYVETVAPEIKSYNINATYYILEDASATTVQRAVNETIEKFVAWEYESLGRDINPDKLQSLLYGITGMKRVVITEPIFQRLEKTQIALANNISVTLAGSEDE